VTWRPWAVLVALFTSFAVNLVLVSQERLPEADAGEEVERIDEPLRHVLYSPGQRRANFEEFGMDPKLADTTASLIANYGRAHGKRLEAMLEEQAPAVSRAFCAISGEVVPQPYAAMQFLVREENGRRDVLPVGDLLEFEPQPWFDKTPVNSVYQKMEVRKDRRADATLMGVSSLLAAREADAIGQRSPFQVGLMVGGFDAVTRDTPRVRQVAIEYFALMHYLTELANKEGGICN
jgi:hypothetical protein